MCKAPNKMSRFQAIQLDILLDQAKKKKKYLSQCDFFFWELYYCSLNKNICLCLNLTHRFSNFMQNTRIDTWANLLLLFSNISRLNIIQCCLKIIEFLLKISQENSGKKTIPRFMIEMIGENFNNYPKLCTVLVMSVLALITRLISWTRATSTGTLAAVPVWGYRNKYKISIDRQNWVKT